MCVRVNRGKEGERDEVFFHEEKEVGKEVRKKVIEAKKQAKTQKKTVKEPHAAKALTISQIDRH